MSTVAMAAVDAQRSRLHKAIDDAILARQSLQTIKAALVFQPELRQNLEEAEQHSQALLNQVHSLLFGDGDIPQPAGPGA